jgi:hypothetical protein
MDGENCGGASRELGPDGARVDAKCFRIAVRKDGLEAIPEDTMRTGMERETRKNYFALKIQRAKSEDKACRAT